MDESVPLLPTVARKWPYIVCLPVFFHCLVYLSYVGVQSQWLLVYLCGHQDATSKFFPGLFYKTPSLPNPEFEYCRQIPEVQALASQWSMILHVTMGIPALLAVPLYGILSDRFGRKPVLLSSMFASCIVISGYLSVTILDFGLWVLILVNFISGCLGSYYIMVGAVLSYVSDLTLPTERAQAFLIVEATYFAGFACGPILGGFLARHFPNGPQDVFLLAFSLDLVIITLVILLLPESFKNRPDSNSESIVQNVKSSIRNVTSVFKAYMSKAFALLLLASCTAPIPTVTHSLFFYYVSYRFGWDSQDEGVYLLVSSITRMACMVLVYPVLTRLFSSFIAGGKKTTLDLNLLRMALFLAAVAPVLQGLVPNGIDLFFITPIQAFGSLAMPTLRSLLSKTIPSDSQGALFSGLSFIEQIFGVVFNLTLPMVWKSTVKTQPNAFLFVIGFIYLFGSGTVWFTAPEDLDEVDIECEVTSDGSVPHLEIEN
ncbi:major facilitator superfamily domain-containing protein [Globomyces pollinis-pini]|nr:major facilitator superfamily domain-containing protein [Globomyces pollinis-pini]